MPLRVSWSALSVVGKRKVAVYGRRNAARIGMGNWCYNLRVVEWAPVRSGMSDGIRLLHMHCF